MNIKIGDKLIATEEIRYCMGQAEDDCIRESEIVRVDGLPKQGYVFVQEHADRYGPYPIESFRIATDEELERDYLENNTDQVRTY